MLYNDLIEYKKLKERIVYFEFMTQLEGTDGKSFIVLADLKEKQHQIQKNVDTFSEPSKTILKLKYFEGKSLKEIALELNYSYGYMRQLHSKLIRLIKNLDPYIKY